MGPAFHLALAIGLSLALSLLVATGMVYAHVWNPVAGTWTIAGLTLCLLAAPRIAAVMHKPAPPAKATPTSRGEVGHAEH